MLNDLIRRVGEAGLVGTVYNGFRTITKRSDFQASAKQDHPTC